MNVLKSVRIQATRAYKQYVEAPKISPTKIHLYGNGIPLCNFHDAFMAIFDEIDWSI